MASGRGREQPSEDPGLPRGSLFRDEAGPSRSSDSQMFGEVQELLRGMSRSLEQMASRLGVGSAGPMHSAPVPTPGFAFVPPASFQPVPEAGEPERRMRLFAEFRRMQPPVFSGGADPVAAEEWIDVMGRLLDVAMIPEHDRVAMAVSFLRGEASTWWQSLIQLQGMSAMRWEGFVVVFCCRYLVVRRQEFVSLIQRRMSVTQYEAQFSALARFAPDLVTSEEVRIRRFVDGLRPSVRSRLGALPVGDYSAVVEMALSVERRREDYVRARERSRSRYRVRESRSQVGGSSIQALPALVEAQRGISSHPSQLVRCYGCRQMGHIRAHCPYRSSQRSSQR